jgi:hypothetical protein
VMQAVIDNHGYQEASRGGPMSAAN